MHVTAGIQKHSMQDMTLDSFTYSWLMQVTNKKQRVTSWHEAWYSTVVLVTIILHAVSAKRVACHHRYRYQSISSSSSSCHDQLLAHAGSVPVPDV